MRFFSLFTTALVAATAVLAAPVKTGHTKRDVSIPALPPVAGVDLSVNVSVNLACVIGQVHDHVVAIKSQVDVIIADTTTTVEDKCGKIVPLVWTLVTDITGDVTAIVTGTVASVQPTVDTTLATVGAKLMDALTLVAELVAAVLKLVGGSLSLVSVVLVAVCRVLNLLVATILGLVPSLTAYCGSFTVILTPVLQSAGVSLPGVTA